jgi:hypothetical protein
VAEEPELRNAERWDHLADGENARARTLAEACDALDPRVDHGRRSWDVLEGDAYERGPDTPARIHRDRAAYLEGRLSVLRERAAWRTDLAQARRQGLGRFGVEERYLDVTRERIRAVGGIDASLREELGRTTNSAIDRAVEGED